MRVTKEDTEKKGKTIKFVQKNITSNPSRNVTLISHLPQKNQGGEMYGM